jgi:hypothetical protein
MGESGYFCHETSFIDDGGHPDGLRDKERKPGAAAGGVPFVGEEQGVRASTPRRLR